MTIQTAACFFGLACLTLTPARCDSTAPGHGIETDSVLLQWPPASPSTEPLTSAWQLENPAEATAAFSADGIHVTSDKGNPMLSCLYDFEAPLVTQLTLDYNPDKNSLIFIQIFDKLSVAYNQSSQAFVLQAKDNPAIFGGTSQVLQKKEVNLQEICPNLSKVTLTIALTSDALLVWCGDTLIFRQDVSTLSMPASGKIRLGSGWKSDWTVKNAAAYHVSKMPN